MFAALLVAAIALSLGLTFRLRGFAGEQRPVADQLDGLLSRAAAPAVVYSEFGEEADVFWAADPDNPADRVELATGRHAAGFGVTPALSPDGAHLAYAALPPDGDGLGLETAAELWMLDVANGDAQRLATGIDLLVPPVWSPDGGSVVVRHGLWRDDGSASFALLRVDLSGATTTLVSAPADLFPIDFSPDGAQLYYAALTPDGTALQRVALAGGAPEMLYRLSDGIARDWQLSPDGTRLAYMAQAPADAQDAFDLRVLDLDTGDVQAPAADASPAFSPLWDGDGALTVGSVAAGGAPARYDVGDAGIALDAPLLTARANRAGFDVPLSWSPDSNRLAARAFDDVTASDAGPSRVVVLGTNGSRRALSSKSDIVIAGWLGTFP
ncbi:MAG: hypothetical protein WBD55_01810 [Dehalococcoidia bacterium]